jgi:hypothetical protein
MRKVIHSNYLNSPALHDYLSSSKGNFAVLTDYAAIEAYKGNTLKSIYPSMEIVSEFPRQVLILKSTTKIVGMSGREKGLQRRLIDGHQTSGFPKFCKDLSKAKSGNKALEKALVQLGIEASEHLEKVMSDAKKLPKAIDAITNDFIQQELDIIRKGAPLTQEFVDKIIKHAMTTAGFMGVDHPQSRGWPPLDELPNTYLLRYALSGIVYMVQRIEFGGVGGLKPEKLRNDVVDLSFSAYATYFDGLLTNDRKLISIYEFTLALLNFFKRSLANEGNIE